VKLYIVLTLLGLAFGASLALLGVGVVAIFRSSKVFNLAHGAMAMLPAFIGYQIFSGATIDIGGVWQIESPPAIRVGWVAILLALAFGTGLGYGIDRVLLRPIRDRPVLTQVIMTVGVLIVLIGIAVAFFGTSGVSPPSLFPKTQVPIGDIGALSINSIATIVITGIVSVLLFMFFKFTNLGIAMRATAESREAAVLMGVNPERMSAITWAGGGFLAALAGILLTPESQAHPYTTTLLAIPAFVAALLAGLTSLPLVVAASMGIGVMWTVVPQLASNIPYVKGIEGIRELAILVLVLTILVARSKVLYTVESEDI
jgi:branched-chain amino acid transport system permease protein